MSTIRLDKIKTETQRIKAAVRTQTLSSVTSALGLVAGLAWNDAIKNFIEVLFPLAKNSLFAKFLYALIMTVIVATLIHYLTSILAPQPTIVEVKGTDKK